MHEDEFWGLIALIDTSALDQGREEDAIEPLQQASNSRLWDF